MHAANRSQVVGGASALAVGALAVGALVAPFATPNIEVPVVKAPVALAAASPLNTIAGLITAGQQAGGGVIGSAGQANTLYPTDAIFIGSSLVTQVQSLINNPSTIPAAIEHLPTQIEGLVELGEQQSTGVIAGGTTVVNLNPNPMTPPVLATAYTLPGQYVPATRVPQVGVNPALWPSTQTVNNPATAGFLAAATTIDNVTPSGLPKLATPITRGAGEVGTSLIQAGGLVRSASVTAVQGTFTAVASGNPGAVVNSFRTGADGVAKSVFGDSTVKKVTPIGNGLGIVTGGPSDTVEPVKRLGAIRTVTQTTGNAVKNVADAATP